MLNPQEGGTLPFLIRRAARGNGDERRWTLPIFLSDVKARRGELTADGLQLTARTRMGLVSLKVPLTAGGWQSEVNSRQSVACDR